MSCVESGRDWNVFVGILEVCQAAWRSANLATATAVPAPTLARPCAAALFPCISRPVLQSFFQTHVILAFICVLSLSLLSNNDQIVFSSLRQL